MANPKSPFRADLLKGKVILITGGATGINFGIATAFAAHGANLAILGRRSNVVQKACEELKKLGCEAIGIQGDVRREESAREAVQRTIEKFGKLDVLVNGAAGNFLVTAEDLAVKGFKTVVDIDLVGTFNMSTACFDELRKTKGCIINISATLHYGATLWQVHASAAKAGVDSVTRSLALEWADYCIRVNGIAPGAIKGTEGANRLGATQFESAVAERVPLKRMGLVEDIGLAALFLASNETSGYVTGDTLVVDGGLWLARPHLVGREFVQQLTQDRSKSKL